MRKITKAELDGTDTKIVTFTKAPLGAFSKPSYSTGHDRFSQDFDFNLTFHFDSLSIKIHDTGLERDFMLAPVAAMFVDDLAPGFKEAAVFFDNYDNEGWLMEEGDVLLLSSLLKRDLHRGRDEYQFAVLDAPAFGTFFRRVACESFKPSEPGSYRTRIDDTRPPVSQTASLRDQLAGITFYKGDNFRAHHKHIIEIFDEIADAVMEDALKADLLSGNGYRPEALIHTVEKKLGPDATEVLDLKYKPYKAMKAVMKDKALADAVTAKGEEYVKTTLAQWVEDAEAVFDNEKSYTSLSVANIFAYATRKGHPSNVFAFHAGGSPLLHQALAAEFLPRIDAHIEQVTTGAFGIGWLRERNVSAVKAQVRSVLTPGMN